MTAQILLFPAVPSRGQRWPRNPEPPMEEVASFPVVRPRSAGEITIRLAVPEDMYTGLWSGRRSPKAARVRRSRAQTCARVALDAALFHLRQVAADTDGALISASSTAKGSRESEEAWAARLRAAADDTEAADRLRAAVALDGLAPDTIAPSHYHGGALALAQSIASRRDHAEPLDRPPEISSGAVVITIRIVAEAYAVECLLSRNSSSRSLATDSRTMRAVQWLRVAAVILGGRLHVGLTTPLATRRHWLCRTPAEIRHWVTAGRLPPMPSPPVVSETSDDWGPLPETAPLEADGHVWPAPGRGRK